MQFKSRLTGEQIQEVLKSHTRPFTFLNMTMGNAFLSKFKKNQFYLMKTSKWSNAGNPFIGKIAETENGSLIIGKFAPSKAIWIGASTFWGLSWVMFLLACIRNKDIGFTLVVVFFLICFTLFGLLLITVLPNLFFKKQKGEVIDFIKENLQAELIEGKN